MADPRALRVLLDALEETVRALRRFANELDAARKADLLALRRTLSQQIGALPQAMQDAGLAEQPDFRSRYSAMRNAIALHQASWSVVLIDGAGADYQRSGERTSAIITDFIAWARTACDRDIRPRPMPAAAPTTRRTQVAIIGCGPSGLLLGHLLRAAGVDCVIIERQTRARINDRIRAGVLETTTTDLLHRLGLDARLNAEGISESGFVLADGDRVVRIDTARLTGRSVTVYGQTEVTRDLIDAALDRGLEMIFEAADVALHDIDGDLPAITFIQGGQQHRIEADFIAGCDGFHGPSRRAIPASAVREYERVYPFGWLGILADVPPCHGELIYINGDEGFALASMRSLTRSRYYIQVPLTERLEDWPEARLWDELERRFAPLASRPVVRGPALEMSIAPLRSYVFEPMRHGRLFLAGDAAHIVPPTGAKGLNLAASDVAYLSDALIAHYLRGDEAGLHGYQDRALARIWKAERFSWYLTKLLHRFPEDGPFERRMQIAELDYLAQSEAMQTAIAENYVGLPL